VVPAVQARLAAYPWPGNVRELQNVAKAAMVAAHPGRTVLEQHLPSRLLRPAFCKERSGSLEARLREAERRIIEEAVREAGGNFSAAARTLGLSRQGLFAKMKRLAMK
jgi:transcriptional regulator with PAS, ATPase and Fis domain